MSIDQSPTDSGELIGKGWYFIHGQEGRNVFCFYEKIEFVFWTKASKCGGVEYRIYVVWVRYITKITRSIFSVNVSKKISLKSETSSSFRHWCDQNDQLKYGWTYHDGEMFGIENVTDHNLQLKIEWMRQNSGGHGGDWTTRINALPQVCRE